VPCDAAPHAAKLRVGSRRIERLFAPSARLAHAPQPLRLREPRAPRVRRRFEMGNIGPLPRDGSFTRTSGPARTRRQSRSWATCGLRARYGGPRDVSSWPHVGPPDLDRRGPLAGIEPPSKARKAPAHEPFQMPIARNSLASSSRHHNSFLQLSASRARGSRSGGGPLSSLRLRYR
jgi:hypothetical protein